MRMPVILPTTVNVVATAVLLVVSVVAGNRTWADPPPPDAIRVATYNVSLYGRQSGDVIDRLADAGDDQIESLVRVIQTVRPDILLVNELDYDVEGLAARRLRSRLAGGEQPLDYPHQFVASSNTGVPSGHDLDQDGNTNGPADAFGFGRFPGQYGLAVLSRFPIQSDQVRTFQKFRWQDLPEHRMPRRPNGEPYYDEAVWSSLRLSSKNHIDVPVTVRSNTVHLLASHPTPPVFDGPEDRNGLRNRDEIRFWQHYIDNHSSIVDDQSVAGGLAKHQSFVIAGDLNSDPSAGDSIRDGITDLLNHQRVNDFVPSHSRGTTTALFRSGAARVDYCLPSSDLTVVDGGVYWPAQPPGSEWVKASDHRMVWVDVRFDASASKSIDGSDR